MKDRQRSPRGLLVALAAIALVLGGVAISAPPADPAAGLKAEPNAAAPAKGAEKLETRVRALLTAKCSRCHGEKQQKADLNLATAAGIAKGSESGVVVVAGKPDKSLLYEVVHEKRMPPEGEGALTAEEIESIRQWIAAGATFVSAEAPQVSQNDIVPLMYLRCAVCHGLRRKDAGLDLRTKAAMLKGGKSGPAIVPGKPAESLVLKRIHAGEMPPRREVVAVSIKPMEPNEIQLLEKWIAAGAPEVSEEVLAADRTSQITEEDRKFWSFQPPQRPAIPEVNGRDRVANPIDAFLLAKLEAKDLSFSAEAAKGILIRRAWFDLVGLPPTPDDVARVEADTAPGWYERMIDRLLASPAYGERWGRYWLDLAGYSDSQGIQDSDIIRPENYRYRDYVVRSLNDDKPYDQFLHEQIAGDELVDYERASPVTPQIADDLIATGFLRMCADGTHANITNFVPDRLDIIAQEVEILTSATMGLTLKCARCHSHKFDPIPHQDYYRLLAVFKGAMDEHDWMNPESARFLPQVTTAERSEWETRDKGITADIAAANAALVKPREELTAKLVQERLAKHPAELQEQLRALLPVAKDKATPEQKALLEKYEKELKELRIEEKDLPGLDAGYKKMADETAARVKTLEGQRTAAPRIRALWDRGEPSPTFVLKRGNYLTPGRPVEPGPPEILSEAGFRYEPVALQHQSKKTGRRLAFARWLTRPNHPLTARVMVNRLWEHHFGRGIVETTDNFGKSGAAPTHPELLDWLAVELIGDRGLRTADLNSGDPSFNPQSTIRNPQSWTLKRLHRLIMTSSAYRQSSAVLPVHEERDPSNALLSRMPVRRLEAEALHDALVAVSGRLDATPFGPGDPVDVRGDGLVTVRPRSGQWRRTIYVLQRRTTIPTLLENFDLPAMAPNCVARRPSTVAPQALNLLNGGFVNELAESFAKRVRAEAGDDPARQIERAYQLAFARQPGTVEFSTASDLYHDLTERWMLEAGGKEHAVTASTHLWIRESAPDKVYEDDLVSVWSSKSSDGKRRFGLIEFDLSAFKDVPLQGARLELGAIMAGPLKQSAALIPPGINGLTWNSYQKAKASGAVPLEELGRIDVNTANGLVGRYVASKETTEADLTVLSDRIAKDGKIAFVLIPAEDGSYAQDWDDGVHPSTHRNLPKLIVRDTESDVEAARRRALINVCRALLNSAAFVYID